MRLKLVISLLCVSITSFAKPVVNAIAFWGFLDNPNIVNSIESECNVKFSHDRYYTNSEFLDTYESHKNEYDVMVVSNLIYGSIKDEIPILNDSILYTNANNYYPYFKKYYHHNNYPKNIAFLTHAMVGILYNPKNITISNDMDMFDFFKQAKNKDVVLVDDSGEIGNMLTQSYNEHYHTNKQVKLTYENLKKLTQDSHVYITSEFSKIYENPNFAFAYIWSGDALLFLKSAHKNLKFILPDHSTSICTDLIIQMNNTPQAKCVANYLASQKLQKLFESNTYYFSPYFHNDINDLQYSNLYLYSKKHLSNFKMIEPVHDFRGYYNQNWEEIKLRLLHEQK